MHKCIPEHEFEIADSGCCGMAGSFGLEAEHTDIGFLMAENGLLPALRASRDATIVCNGFSCRQQIKHLTGHCAIHLAELLRETITIEKVKVL